MIVVVSGRVLVSRHCRPDHCLQPKDPAMRKQLEEGQMVLDGKRVAKSMAKEVRQAALSLTVSCRLSRSPCGR